MTPEHELAIERRISAPVATVWRAWTQHLPKWWAPRPWTTELLGLDLIPGGRFATTMRGPGGEAMAVARLSTTGVRRRGVTGTVARSPAARRGSAQRQRAAAARRGSAQRHGRTGWR